MNVQVRGGGAAPSALPPARASAHACPSLPAIRRHHLARMQTARRAPTGRTSARRAARRARRATTRRPKPSSARPARPAPTRPAARRPASAAPRAPTRPAARAPAPCARPARFPTMATAPAAVRASAVPPWEPLELNRDAHRGGFVCALVARGRVGLLQCATIARRASAAQLANASVRRRIRRFHPLSKRARALTGGTPELTAISRAPSLSDWHDLPHGRLDQLQPYALPREEPMPFLPTLTVHARGRQRQCACACAQNVPLAASPILARPVVPVRASPLPAAAPFPARRAHPRCRASSTSSGRPACPAGTSAAPGDTACSGACHQNVTGRRRCCMRTDGSPTSRAPIPSGTRKRARPTRTRRRGARALLARPTASPPAPARPRASAPPTMPAAAPPHPS